MYNVGGRVWGVGCGRCLGVGAFRPVVRPMLVRRFEHSVRLPELRLMSVGLDLSVWYLGGIVEDLGFMV